MALTKQEIEQVAMWARLKLDDEETELFREQLNSILACIGELDALDTEGVEPLIHILPIINVFREDVAHPGMSREELLANAKMVEDGQFKVPRIV